MGVVLMLWPFEALTNGGFQQAILVLFQVADQSGSIGQCPGLYH